MRLGLAIVWSAALPTMVRAEGTDPSSAPAPSARSNPIRDGTAAVGLLILLSTAALAGAIDLIPRLRRGRLAPRELAEELRRECDLGRRAEALAIAEEAGDSCLLAATVSAGIQRAGRPGATTAEILRAAENAGRRGAARLDRRIALVAAVGLVAPPIGLLGTVQAMIDGAAAQPDLAALIGRSLTPTLWGLVASILAQGAAALLRLRLDSSADVVAEQAESILEPLGTDRS